MKTLFLCLLAFASVASAKVTIHDYVRPFVDGYKPSKSIDANQIYILRYEYLYGKEIESAFFGGNKISTRERALEKLDKYAKNLPSLVKSYKVKVPEIISAIDVVEQKMKSVFDQELDANVFLFTALPATDARAAGSLSYSFALNLRLVSDYSKETIQIVIAHELFHLLQDKTLPKEKDRGSILEEQIFLEGWATYASSLLFPGLPDWKYVSSFSHDEAQFARFEKDRNQIIDSILNDWESKDYAVIKKYISGNPQDSAPFEPRSAYYIGYLAAKKMAESSDPKKVALISKGDFRAKIKTVLKDLKTAP